MVETRSGCQEHTGATEHSDAATRTEKSTSFASETSATMPIADPRWPSDRDMDSPADKLTEKEMRLEIGPDESAGISTDVSLDVSGSYDPSVWVWS